MNEFLLNLCRRMKPIAALTGALLIAAGFRAEACTVFVLTDGTRVLFFNNEDWFNPATRVWFVPAGRDHLGCAYLGFDDGWAQGGLNTAGLAFDWVSGSQEPYKPDPGLQPVRGNPSERMLESCTTVGEAVAFYGKFLEPDFRRARLFVADRSGASAVIGAREGRLQITPFQGSHGFGWGRVALERELAKSPEPSVARGAAILRACRQPGAGGTKYSNAFDLRSGEMVLFPDPDRDGGVSMNLVSELAKGPHYYALADLHGSLPAVSRPLLNNMKRFYLDAFAPLADQEPVITGRIRTLLQDTANGAMRSGDYAPELWSALASRQKQTRDELKALGELVSLTLVGREEMGAGRGYLYKAEFDRITVLQRLVFNERDQVESIRTEASEFKPGTRPMTD